MTTPFSVPAETCSFYFIFSEFIFTRVSHFALSTYHMDVGYCLYHRNDISPRCKHPQGITLVNPPSEVFVPFTCPLSSPVRQTHSNGISTVQASALSLRRKTSSGHQSHIRISLFVLLILLPPPTKLQIATLHLETGSSLDGVAQSLPKLLYEVHGYQRL
jgi:hypothetical protein